MLVTKKKKKENEKRIEEKGQKKEISLSFKKSENTLFFLFCVCFVGAVVAAQPVYLRRLLFCAFYDFFNRNNNS